MGASLVARHKEYCKGEGGGFPQVWVVVNLVSSCLPVVRLITHPSLHPRALACPSTPKCVELRRVPQFLVLSLFSHLDSQLSPSKSLGVHHLR